MCGVDKLDTYLNNYYLVLEVKIGIGLSWSIWFVFFRSVHIVFTDFRNIVHQYVRSDLTSVRKSVSTPNLMSFDTNSHFLDRYYMTQDKECNGISPVEKLRIGSDENDRNISDKLDILKSKILRAIDKICQKKKRPDTDSICDFITRTCATNIN